MKRLMLVTVIAAAGCTNGPNFGANVGINGSGVTVNPRVSGSVGGVGVVVTP